MESARQPHRKPRRPCARGFPRPRRQELDEAHAGLARRPRQGDDRLRPVHTYTMTNDMQLHRAEGAGLLMSCGIARYLQVVRMRVHAYDPKRIKPHMVEFTLPKNSKVTEGKTWAYPPGAQNVREFRVYRWNPDEGNNPRIDTYHVDTADCGPMVLDALIWIKNNIDPTLTFRRSCREGVCGSCAMNIDGAQHAGLHQGMDDVKGAGARSIRCRTSRWSRTWCPTSTISTPSTPRSSPGCTPRRRRREKEWRQSQEDRVKLDGLYECILCACCSTSCPSYWWNERALPRARRAAAGLPLDHRQPRRGHRRAARRSRGPVQALPLPHHHELRQGLPQGAEPRQGDRRDQASMVERKV